MTRPLVLYVPGLLPKPEAGVHRKALRRCLLEGLRRHDAEVAREFAEAVSRLRFVTPPVLHPVATHNMEFGLRPLPDVPAIAVRGSDLRQDAVEQATPQGLDHSSCRVGGVINVALKLKRWRFAQQFRGDSEAFNFAKGIRHRPA